MAFSLSTADFNTYIQGLTQHYRLFAPIKKVGKGPFSEQDLIGYREVLDASEIIWSEKSYFSPKEVFFPIRETLFRFLDQQASVPAIDTRPILLFLRPCDLNGIGRLDDIFLKNGTDPDFYYARRRELLKFAVMACDEGFDTCFCASMGSNQVAGYDLAIYIGGMATKDQVVLDIQSPAFLPKAAEGAGEQERTADNKQVVETNIGQEGKDKSKILQNARFVQQLTDKQLKVFSEALPLLAPLKNKIEVVVPDFEGIELDQIFNHALWQEYTRRCIACGRCNTSCITCSCFTMQDVYTDDNKQMAERRRRWAGCHVDRFSDMAGGHTFRAKNGERMRFKLMHKVYDFQKRFDRHMCVGCGRCDDVCPEYISFPAAIAKVAQIIEEVKANAK